ncbi:unnamed protein product [Arctia plantaginis]|uniref:FP protein C-terminal domain-containing protein n=1 Tax=Arctia plantaginis TaxID=874455 RepID=A0A8S0YV02_ARCPL|nr:unnamed protein product [Arctia plantaginis]CAB3227506.1 unnamed protein product [Arctia plantaginis]
MSVKRTPPKSSSKLLTSPVHYGSDSAIYSLENQECADLNIAKRSKRRRNDPSSAADITLSDLMARMDEIKKQQDARFASLESSIIQSLSVQNEEMKESIMYLSSKYDDVLSNLKALQQENNYFKTQIKTLEAKLEQFAINARSSTIELRNVPTSEPETKEQLVEVAKKIGTLIQAPVEDSDIRDVIRMKLKNQEPGPVLVEFTSTIKRERFLKATRNYNKNNTGQRLSTSSLCINGPTKHIFVSESLTAPARRLHYLARMFAKDYNYEHCWTSFGKVYLKRRSNETRLRISCEEDIEKLKKTK